MKLWLALRNAAVGWFGILAGWTDWRKGFVFSRAGFATALVIYFLVGFMVIVLGAIDTGLPGVIGTVVNLLVQGINILVLVASVFITKSTLRSPAPMLEILVPGIYGLAFYLIVGSLLAMLDLQLVGLVLVGLAYILFRLGRAAGGWTIGASMAFGVFTVLLLVAVPISIYMLTVPAGSPI